MARTLIDVPASVTITADCAVQYEPSLMRATATSVCEVARRIRVDTVALPLRGVKWNIATSRCGLRVLKTAMALTWSAAVIGLSALTVRGTVLPFSTSGATSRRTRPSRGAAPPVKSRTAASSSAAAATAGRGATPHSATPAKISCRRSITAP